MRPVHGPHSANPLHLVDIMRGDVERLGSHREVGQDFSLAISVYHKSSSKSSIWPGLLGRDSHCVRRVCPLTVNRTLADVMVCFDVIDYWHHKNHAPGRGTWDHAEGTQPAGPAGRMWIVKALKSLLVALAS